MSFTVKGYGWKPDLPDQRDHLYHAPKAITLPSSVDLRPHCPAVYDQGALGSCTANAIAGAIEYNQIVAGSTPFIPSRLFIYYNERMIEHSVRSDAGAMLRDGIKTIASTGVCDEAMWPYLIPKFRKKPTPACYTAAKTDLITSYSKLDNTQIDLLRACLASGSPFVFGFTVYQSFEGGTVASDGIVPMPRPRETVLGGHAVLAVGYDDVTQRFLARNSWSPGWGMAGYFTMPYQYLTSTQLATDFWQITSA